MQNVYIDVVIVSGILGFFMFLLWSFLSKTMRGEPGPGKPPNFYDSSYSPGMVGSSKEPLPIGAGRKKRNRN